MKYSIPLFCLLLAHTIVPIHQATGFAAKVGGVLDSVGTGSGSDRIRVHPQCKISSFVIQRSF